MQGIPIIVENVLNDYVDLVNERIPNMLEGVYIQGSIALNAYVKDSSDIDFITVTNRRLLEEEAEVLSEIHSRIAEKYRKPELDGVYILWEDLGKLETCDNVYPFYNGGELSYGVHFNPITWWLLKTKGINFIGPERTSLTFEIQSKHLVSYVTENMNSYWAQRTQRIENAIEDLINLPTEDIDNEIEWSVLGLLRQYYTIKEHEIISKLGAGEYGLLHVPEEWHLIIKEAINIRKGVKKGLFTSNQERTDSAIAFSKYIIKYCNSSLSKM